MKKLLTIICIALICATVKGQYIEGDEHQVAKLKKTATVFFFKTDNEDSLEFLQQILDSAWTFTDIIAASISDKEAYTDAELDEYSFFELGGSYVETNGSRNIYASLDLSMYNNRVTLGRIDLFTSPKFLWDILKAYRNGGLNNFDLYAYESEFYNWNLGFIKNYLKAMSFCLENKQKEKAINALETLNVKMDTLFIPDYTFKRYNRYTGRVKKSLKAEKILKDYKYPYKIITTEELSKKILTSETSFYYLDYNRRGTYSTFRIRNSITGEIAYFDSFEMNPKANKFKKMYKELKAAGEGKDG